MQVEEGQIGGHQYYRSFFTVSAQKCHMTCEAEDRCMASFHLPSEAEDMQMCFLYGYVSDLSPTQASVYGTSVGKLFCPEGEDVSYKYSRTSVAQTLMACLFCLTRTCFWVPRVSGIQ